MPIHPVTALGPGFSTNYTKFQLGMIVQFDYVSKHSKRSSKRSVWILDTGGTKRSGQQGYYLYGIDIGSISAAVFENIAKSLEVIPCGPNSIYAPGDVDVPLIQFSGGLEGRQAYQRVKTMAQIASYYRSFDIANLNQPMVHQYNFQNKLLYDPTKLHDFLEKKMKLEPIPSGKEDDYILMATAIDSQVDFGNKKPKPPEDKDPDEDNTPQVPDTEGPKTGKTKADFGGDAA